MYFKKAVACILILSFCLSGLNCASIPNNPLARVLVCGVAGAAVGYLIADNLKISNKNRNITTAVAAAAGIAFCEIIHKRMNKQKKVLEQKFPNAQVESVETEIKYGVLAVPGCKITFNEAKFAFFDKGKAELLPGGKDSLAILAAAIDREMLVRIGGHTDARGDDAMNQKLSEARANAVYDYLITKGITEAQLSVQGYGESKTLCAEDTDACHTKNRRVEIVIVPSQKLVASTELQAAQESGMVAKN